jgi:hypothetical protein
VYLERLGSSVRILPATANTTRNNTTCSCKAVKTAQRSINSLPSLAQAKSENSSKLYD